MNRARWPVVDHPDEGVCFARKPITLRQDLRAIDFRTIDVLNLFNLEIAYVRDGTAIPVAGSLLEALEFLAADFDFFRGRVEFDVNHFSGYIVAWGRSRYY